MTVLGKINSKDPLKLADDDHLEAKDISAKEFREGLRELVKKHKLKDKTGPQKPSEFSKAIIEALNSAD